MRRLRNIGFLLVLMVGFAFFTRHNLTRAWSQTHGTTPSGAAVLRIISPKDGARLKQNFVAVQYVQLQPSSAPIPTFELRMDAGDPVHTTDTSHNFTGLTPGTHDLIVQMIDANNLPIAGTQAEVHFTILPQAQNGTGQQQPGNPATPRQQQSNPSNQGQSNPGGEASPRGSSEMNMLPDARSSLPLLSVIGFGVLIGGLISALRTRPAGNR